MYPRVRRTFDLYRSVPMEIIEIVLRGNVADRRKHERTVTISITVSNLFLRSTTFVPLKYRVLRNQIKTHGTL